MDKRDGFLHLSSGPQLVETLRAHFDGIRDLVVLKIDPNALGAPLRWEVSRGGEPFPHLYAPLPVSAVVEVMPVPDDREERVRVFGGL